MVPGDGAASKPDIEQLIRADFVALLADAIDTAAINASNQQQLVEASTDVLVALAL